MNKQFFLAASFLLFPFFGQLWPWSAKPVTPSTDQLSAYRVATDTIDVYTTDKKIAAIRSDIYAIINKALATRQNPVIDQARYPNLTATVLMNTLSPQAAQAGAHIKITGRNLDPGAKNNVYFISPATHETFVVKNLTAANGGLGFTLPHFPSGRYDVAVSNSHGISNTLFFITLNTTSPTVSIDSLSPAAVRWGEMLIVHGSGFTPTGNEIFTTFDTISNVPSADGHTLSVRIAPEQMRVEASMGTGTIPVADTLGVVNDNGYTTSLKNFSIHL